MAHHTIALKGPYIRKEQTASGAVTPGMTVNVAGAAGGNLRKAFALENDLVGEGIDDAYEDGDLMQVGVFPPGAEVYALLASGQNVAAGDSLEADSAGRLTAAASGGVVIAFATEAVNAAAAVARIIIEVA